MKIGIVPILDPGFGGIYQYSQTMLEVLQSLTSQGRGDEFILFAKDPGAPQVESLSLAGWDVRPFFPPDWRRKIELGIQKRTGIDLPNKVWRLTQQVTHGAGIDQVRRRAGLTRWLKQFQLDLMIYPAPDALAFEVGIPYVMAVHDLQHRLQPDFPEISANGNLYWREYLFRNAARYATLLISESEVGKQDILRYYADVGIDAGRIKVLPFLPALTADTHVTGDDIQRVRSAYHLPERYLFYPAQFWQHKNHARIVQALSQIRDARGLKIPVLFTGSQTSRQRGRNFNQLKALIRELVIDDQIFLPGYIPDEDMPGLYTGAAALIMPTFFGPSNIPVLEAWAYGCPVVTSDIHGIREQCGDAALLVDPGSVEAIAGGIYRIWTDQSLRQTLIMRGRDRLAAYSRQDYTGRICDILETAKNIVNGETNA